MAGSQKKRSKAAAACSECGSPDVGPDEAEVRCRCGSLLARRVAAGLEIKCRRCKHTSIVVVDPALASVAPGQQSIAIS
jgi:hypothetical protein